MDNAPKIPCIDCITLAICKQQVLKREQEDYFYLLVPLTEKCSIFKEYIKYLCKSKNVYTNKAILIEPEPIVSLFNLKRRAIELHGTEYE